MVIILIKLRDEKKVWENWDTRVDKMKVLIYNDDNDGEITQDLIKWWTLLWNDWQFFIFLFFSHLHVLLSVVYLVKSDEGIT